jgi:hypothetical protein
VGKKETAGFEMRVNAGLIDQLERVGRGRERPGAAGIAAAPDRAVTPDFSKKTKCISYVRQDQVYTHMIDVMSEISINSNKNVQELDHHIIFFYTQMIDSKVFTTIKR